MKDVKYKDASYKSGKEKRIKPYEPSLGRIPTEMKNPAVGAST